MTGVKKYFLLIYLIFAMSFSYAQKGEYVDKDRKIQKHQKEMAQFLNERMQFGQRMTDLKSMYNSMLVYKIIELFPWSAKSKKPNVLLVKFGSTGSHRATYWALLEADRKFFFRNEPVPNDDLMNYMGYYNSESKEIILTTLQLYRKYD